MGCGGWLGSLGSEYPLGLFQEKLNLPWGRGKAQLASCRLFQLCFLRCYLFLADLFLSLSSDSGRNLQFSAISVKMILIFTL